MIASRVSVLAAAALLASAGLASAEPQRLSTAALDAVTAGIGVGQFWSSEASGGSIATLGLVGGVAETSSTTSSSAAVGGADAAAEGSGSVTRPSILPPFFVTHSRTASCPSAPCDTTASLPPSVGIQEGASVVTGYAIVSGASTNSGTGFFFW